MATPPARTCTSRSAERHRPGRPVGLAGQTGTQPRQLLSLVRVTPTFPNTSDRRLVSTQNRDHPATALRAAACDRESRTAHIGAQLRPHHPYIPGPGRSRSKGAVNTQPKDGDRDRGGGDPQRVGHRRNRHRPDHRLVGVGPAVLRGRRVSHRVFAAGTVGGLIAAAPPQDRRWLVVVGWAIGPMIFASLFVAGAQLVPMSMRFRRYRWQPFCSRCCRPPAGGRATPRAW